MKAIYTTTSLSHLYKVKTFTDSVAAFDPDVRLYVVLVEEIGREREAAVARLIPEAHFLYPKDLPPQELASINPAYNYLEACCAYRPFFGELLFEAYGVERLIYMDSDMLQYASLQPAFEELLLTNFILTPHNNAPAPLSEVANEQGMLRCGIYNAGFIGMRRGEECKRFLAWWKDRMRQYCIMDASQGFYLDQIWLNMVPVYYKKVKVEKDPGYNVAYWNLFQRQVEKQGDTLQVDGNKLRFFHYSGLIEEDAHNISRHMPNLKLEDGSLLKALFDDYRRKLAVNKALFRSLQPSPPPPHPPQQPKPQPSFWQKLRNKVQRTKQSRT
jgi:hypothetical protein